MSKLDACTVAQKATAQWPNMSWQQRLDLKTLLEEGEEINTAAMVMNAVRSLSNDPDRLEKVASVLLVTKNEIDRDDLLAYYVSHETKFTLSQKSIMAAIVDSKFTGNTGIDSIIIKAIVHRDDYQSLIRLERTMKQCVSMFQSQPIHPPLQTLSPMSGFNQMYAMSSNGSPYGTGFNK